MPVGVEVNGRYETAFMNVDCSVVTIADGLWVFLNRIPGLEP